MEADDAMDVDEEGAATGSDPTDEDFVLHVRGSGGGGNSGGSGGGFYGGVGRPKRLPGGGSSSSRNRHRSNTDSQRSRTDWQQRDEHTWVKIVPPWWLEHKTIHFATRVHRDLFKCQPTAVIIDSKGLERVCGILTENRNDMRQQFTLRGNFHDVWDDERVEAGDVLVFIRDPATGKIQLEVNKGAALASTTTTGGGGGGGGGLYNGAGANVVMKLNKAAESIMDWHAANAGSTTSSGRPQRAVRATGYKQYGNTSTTAGTKRGAAAAGGEGYYHLQSQPNGGGGSGGGGGGGSHPNRWAELADGTGAVKTVYKSTLAHQQCPIAGWLFRQLYGRHPTEIDQAMVYDSDLGKHYTFDVQYVSAANVHYITGREFSVWIRESGLKAGEQIKIRLEQQQVEQQHPTAAASRGVGTEPLPAPALVVPTTAVTTQPNPAPLTFIRRVVFQRVPVQHAPNYHYGSTAARGVHHHQPPAPPLPNVYDTVISPPGLMALQALETLATAAGYANIHGTPAIQSVLSGQGLLPGTQLPSPSPYMLKANGGVKPTFGVAAATAAAANTVTTTTNNNNSDNKNNNNDNTMPASAPVDTKPYPHPTANNINSDTNPHRAAIKSLLAKVTGPLLPPPPPPPVPTFVAGPSNGITPVKYDYSAPEAAKRQRTTTAHNTGSLASSFHAAANFTIVDAPPIIYTNNNSDGTTTNRNAVPAIVGNTGQTSNNNKNNSAKEFMEIMAVLNSFEWTEEENTILLKFRAKYAWLDSVGRKIVHANITEFQKNKLALLEVLKAA